MRLRLPSATTLGLALTLFTPWLLGCGSTEIVLSADRLEITAGGIDYAIITAILGKGGNPAAGQTLRFETNNGSFSEDGEQQEAEITTGPNGKAQVRLFSGKLPGTANVVVTYEDPNADVTAVSSISVRFGKPTGRTIPTAESVRLVCQAANIGAMREPIPDIRVGCTLNAQTVDGVTIPLSALDPQLLAEAGTLTKEINPYTDDLELVYSPKGGRAAPVDVPPVAEIGEPGYRGMSGQVHNPRDGLVTLVAVVEAGETFKDENGNGRYDEGEPFTDSPEPFVDANDNGQADSNEQFVDTDGNGVWDAGNQIYDNRARVMAVYKVLWTGPVFNDSTGQAPISSRIIAETPTSMQATTLNVQAIVVDRNLNPIAGFADNSDMLYFNVEGSGVEPISPMDVPIRNTYGFSFDKSAHTELERWRPVAGTFQPEPYKLTLKLEADADPQSFGVVVGAEVTVSPGPSGPSDYADTITERVTQTLTIQ